MLKRGYKVTKVKNEQIDYSTFKEEGEKFKKCPKCSRIAKVHEKGDYLYYQHVVVKAYGNGTYLNEWSKDECKLLW